MVRLSLALRAASPRAARELLETMGVLMVGIRFEPGCLGCQAYLDADVTVRYVEKWASERDLRRRVGSRDFDSLLALMDCASAPPDVEFEIAPKTRHLDFVAEVRGGGRSEATLSIN